jgi:hypothetical protein
MVFKKQRFANYRFKYGESHVISRSLAISDMVGATRAGCNLGSIAADAQLPD